MFSWWVLKIENSEKSYAKEVLYDIFPMYMIYPLSLQLQMKFIFYMNMKFLQLHNANIFQQTGVYGSDVQGCISLEGTLFFMQSLWWHKNFDS